MLRAMKRFARPVYLAFFPAVLLAMLAAERTATFLLGVFPSDPRMWAIWLELRAPFRDLVSFLDAGHSISLQMSIIVAFMAALGLCLVAQSRVRWLFLMNHIAVLVLGISALVAAKQSIVANGLFDATSDALFAVNVHTTSLHAAMLLLGSISCAACHYAYFATARQA
jgi:hypothetical protein